MGYGDDDHGDVLDFVLKNIALHTGSLSLV